MNFLHHSSFFAVMRTRWDRAPASDEELEEWILYCVIWRDNAWTAPGYWIAKWPRSSMTSQAKLAIDLYVRPGVLNFPKQ